MSWSLFWHCSRGEAAHSSISSLCPQPRRLKCLDKHCYAAWDSRQLSAAGTASSANSKNNRSNDYYSGCYVCPEGPWFKPTWAGDVDVRLALTWHVGLKASHRASQGGYKFGEILQSKVVCQHS